MKQIVSEHAVATDVIMVDGACGQVEMQVYECGTSGVMIAIDGSWIDENDEGELYIPSPFNEGTAIVLVDTEEEINPNLKAIGEDHPESVIDEVITAMKEDIEKGDWTAIAELLQFVPKNVLSNYLGDN